MDILKIALVVMNIVEILFIIFFFSFKQKIYTVAAFICLILLLLIDYIYIHTRISISLVMAPIYFACFVLIASMLFMRERKLPYSISGKTAKIFVIIFFSIFLLILLVLFFLIFR